VQQLHPHLPPALQQLQPASGVAAAALSLPQQSSTAGSLSHAAGGS
jgi:hypothetical protein